uniref:F-box domain-containing protein n=1 Tax=Mycena chlorophos TaxID=658473 RepID=A0ABQ0LBN6_MYCCL|nr:predicted protein [Mycena chlorophos]
MAAFPQELLDVFVSHIHPSDRATFEACSLVAPFREASQRCLWETTTLRICVILNTLKTNTDVLYPPQRIVSLKDAAKKADEWPHLFRHIRKIVLVDTNRGSSLGDREMALLRRVLGRTERVVSASFIYASTEVLELLLEFKSASGWPMLREVRIMGHRDVPVDALVRLSTCGIHRLFLDECLIAQSLPSSTTSATGGTVRTLTALKVHAPNEHAGEDDYQDLRDTLTHAVLPPHLESTGPGILELEYPILLDRRNTLSAAYAHTLERLHISAGHMSDMDHLYVFNGTSGISFPDALPQLRYVTFELMFRNVSEHWLYEALEALLDSASTGTRAPKLERIEFQVYVYPWAQYTPRRHDGSDAAELLDLPLGWTLRDKERYLDFLTLLQYLDDSLSLLTGTTFRWCTMQMQLGGDENLWDECKDSVFEAWLRRSMPKLERDGRLEFGVERAVFEARTTRRVSAVSRVADGLADLLRRLAVAIRHNDNASLRLQVPTSPSSPGLRFDIDIAAGAAEETAASLRARGAEAESLLVCEYCGEAPAGDWSRLRGGSMFCVGSVWTSSGRCRRMWSAFGGRRWKRKRDREEWRFHSSS